MTWIVLSALTLTQPEGGTMRANITLPNPPPAVVRQEKFLDCIKIGGALFAVMDSTEVLWDGKPAQYLEVPDEGTELISITINARRRVVTRLEYVTRKDA